jgi:hypothetical protein
MHKENYEQYDSKNISDLTMEKNPGEINEKDIVIQPNDLSVAPQQVTGNQEQPVQIAGNNQYPVIQESNYETLDESVWETLVNLLEIKFLFF